MPFSLISNGIDLEKFQYDPVVRERLRNEYDLSLIHIYTPKRMKESGSYINRTVG